jgi:membrane-bound inhibitor of C-type lysozyme
MIMRLCGVLAALGFIAGATAGAGAQNLNQPKVTAFYNCNGLHLKAIYDNRPNREHVSFVWGAKDYHLRLVSSGSGSRYAGSGLQWWSKGMGATLTTLPEGNVLTTCSGASRFHNLPH